MTFLFLVLKQTKTNVKFDQNCLINSENIRVTHTHAHPSFFANSQLP